MRIVIITGVSGAGKTTALKMLEDFRYFCIDNLPIPLLEKFLPMAADVTGDEFNNIAIGIDVRSGKYLEQLDRILEDMEKSGCPIEILFMDSNDRILIKRYKESRRAHPMSPSGRIEDGIQIERQKMEFLRKKADYIIDTSHLLTRELKKELENIFVNNESFKSLMITVMSFGFKNGIPADADLVFDVRFLPNPYYVDELRYLTGQDQEVFDYVMSSPAAKEFADKLEEMIEFLIPHYKEEGKTSLVIAIGCTGGKHRSVTLARELHQRLLSETGYGIGLLHRDIEKDWIRKKLQGE